MTEILKYIKRKMQEIQDNIGAFHKTGLKDDGMMKIKPSITVCVDFDGKWFNMNILILVKKQKVVLKH